MARPPDDEQVATFPGALPARTGELATVRTDGRPHVAPVWSAPDRSTSGAGSALGDLVLDTAATTVQGRDIRNDPRVALCVDDDRPPFTFVTVEAVATVSEDPDELLHWAPVIGGRSMGEDRAADDGARDGAPGEPVVRHRPTRIVDFADVSD